MMLFHSGFFAERVRQIRTAGIVAASILLISNVSVFFLRLSEGLDTSIPEGPEMAFGMMLYVYIAGLVLTLSAYGWLNRRHTSDFYHSLAIKRSAMYGSSTLAVLFWLTIGLVVYGVVHVQLNLIFRIPFNYLLFFCTWINMWIAAVQMVGAVSIACAISGTRFVNLFATAFILFVPRMLLMVFASFLSIDAPRSIMVMKLSPLLDPSYNILGTPYMSLLSMVGFYFYGESEFVNFANGWAMLYSFCYGLFLLAIGCLAFVRRKSELAGIPTRNKLFQGAIRTAIGLPLLLLAVFMLKEDVTSVALYAFLIAFSFIFYCLYELISTRQAKKMLVSMLFYPICIVIALLYLIIPMGIADAISHDTLDASSIRGYSMCEQTDYFSSYTVPTYAYTQYSTVEIRDAEGIAIVADALNRGDEFITGREQKSIVLITRKNGIKEYRQLYFSTAEWDRLVAIADCDEGYTALQTAFPNGTKYYSAQNLTKQEAAEIGALFASEYASLSVSERASLYYNAYYVEDIPRTRLTLTVLGCYRAKNYQNSYWINELTPKTAKRYLEILEAKNGKSVKLALQAIVNALEEGTDHLEFSMVVGEQNSLDSWSLIGRYMGENEYYSKETDPEYYEIFRILANAETTTDLSDCVMITVDDYGLDDLLSGTWAEGIFSHYARYRCGLKISDSDYQRILMLIQKAEQRIEQNYVYYDEKGM